MISFSHNYFELQDIGSKKMIGKGRKCDGLYVLDDE